MTPLEKRAEESSQLRYSNDLWPMFGEQYRIVYKEGFIDALKDQPEVKALLRALKGEHDGCNYLAYGTCNKCGSNVNSEALKAWGEFTGELK